MKRDRGNMGRRMTLEQRRVLLERIRAEVEGVVEEIQATAASLASVRASDRVSEAERATLGLIGEAQRCQQLELARLYGEYESLALRAKPGA